MTLIFDVDFWCWPLDRCFSSLATFLFPGHSSCHVTGMSFVLFFDFAMSFLPWVLQIWESIFCPQAFFSLHSFPTFSFQAAFVKASLATSGSIREGCKEFIMRFELSPSLFICLYHTAIFQKSINRQVLHIC